jgi:hypothetical protein
MIPIDRIQPINGPNDVFTFPATAEISELAFKPGGLRIVHSRQGLWPPVHIDGKQSADDAQEATLWVILQIDGNWVGAGMERLRPRQTDKPEPNDPLGFVSEWVSGRNFGPFNGHAIKNGDPIGLMVVAGSTRLGAMFTVKERSKVIEMSYPPTGGQPVWVEGQPDAPPARETTPTDAPPKEHTPRKPRGDQHPAAEHVGDVDLSHLATKADLDAAKAEILARIDKLEEGVKESIRQFAPALQRLGGLFG